MTKDESGGAENLVSGLSAQIERVSNKAQRWDGYLARLPEHHRMGMAFTLQIMRVELETAREAMRSGDIQKMMAAYQTLKDYSDDD